MYKLQKRPWEAVLSGLSWSMAAALMGGGVLAAGTWLAEVGPVYLSPWVTLVAMGSPFFGGLVSGLRTEGRGWLHGLAVGGGTGMVLLPMWGWLSGGLVPLTDLSLGLLAMMGWGALGGSAGINLWSYLQRRRTIILRRRAFF